MNDRTNPDGDTSATLRRMATMTKRGLTFSRPFHDVIAAHWRGIEIFRAPGTVVTRHHMDAIDRRILDWADCELARKRSTYRTLGELRGGL